MSAQIAVGIILGFVGLYLLAVVLVLFLLSVLVAVESLKAGVMRVRRRLGLPTW